MKIVFALVAALALSACAVTATPKNPNVCSIGTLVGCTNHNVPAVDGAAP